MKEEGSEKETERMLLYMEFVLDKCVDIWS